MKNVTIWENDYDGAILINTSDIEEGIDLTNYTIFVTNLKSTDISILELGTKFEEWKLKEEENYYDGDEIDINFDVLEKFLQAEKLGELRFSYEFEEPKDSIVYNPQEECFENLEAYETVKYYEYIDEHSNWRKIINDEYSDNIETSLIIDDDNAMSLDMWDGSDEYTGYKFEHQTIYRIAEIDGELVENKFLLEIWDQYQGSIAEGVIMDKEELIAHIEELGDREVSDYIEL